MVREYWLTHNKDTGEVSGKRTDFGDDSRLDLGDLTRDAFDYLSAWYMVDSGKGYGFAYRISKKSIPNYEGRPANLTLHFYRPLSFRGHQITDEELAQVDEAIRQVMTTVTEAACRAERNVQHIGAMTINPPEYMMDELREALEYFF